MKTVIMLLCIAAMLAFGAMNLRSNLEAVPPVTTAD
jgi:hypothetical protein